MRSITRQDIHAQPHLCKCGTDWHIHINQLNSSHTRSPRSPCGGQLLLLLALDSLDIAILIGRMIFRQVRALAEKLLAQCPGFIDSRINTTPLQLGHKVMHHVGKRFVGDGISQIEAIDVGFFNPCLQNVGYR